MSSCCMCHFNIKLRLLTGVKTFNDGRCIDEISPAQHAHQVRVELRDLYPRGAMHFEQKKQQTCGKKNKGRISCKSLKTTVDRL